MVLVVAQVIFPHRAPKDRDGAAPGVHRKHEGLVQSVVQVGPVQGEEYFLPFCSQPEQKVCASGVYVDARVAQEAVRPIDPALGKGGAEHVASDGGNACGWGLDHTDDEGGQSFALGLAQPGQIRHKPREELA